MSRLTVGLCSVCLAGCLDLTVPEPPGPGSVSGRVVLAEPGSSERRPLGGAEVRVLGSGLATTTAPAGTFVLENLELTSGLLLVRAEVGGVARQRVVQLADFGTGARRRVNLGDLVLGENARVRGKVLRVDVLPARGGHGGSTVFVPAGPFTATTNDDGSYSFEQMPEGPVELFVFRAGYEPASLGGLRLRSGETVELRDVVLKEATSLAPGTVRGSLAFVPTAVGVGDAAVRLVSPETTLPVPVAEDLSFQAASVPVGLYRLVASRSGYTSVDVINVLVTSGRETNFGAVTLTTQPAFDAGPIPLPFDAGAFDAGDAGMGDAGVPDAGGVDAGGVDAGGADAGGLPDAGAGVACTRQNDCTQGFWCDVNRCVPLCTSSADCGFNRACDPTTRTCVLSCVGQCPAGTLCNAQNVCQAVCDATFPCPTGQRCSAGQCVPECTQAADCNSPFLTCDLGICKRNGTCVTDLDCSREQLCVTGQCGARPTATAPRPDGGAWLDGGALFTCTQPCHCKVGERCSDGFCEVDVVPNRFVARDAGGTGLTAATPTGALLGTVAAGNVVVGLLAQDTWDLGSATLSVPGNTHLAGGFTVCGANRWVRDTAARTVVTGVGTPGPGNALVAAYASVVSGTRSNVAVSGLSVRATGTGRCGTTAADFRFVNGLTLEDVDGDIQLGACLVSGRSTLFGVSDSTNVVVRRARLNGLSMISGSATFGFLYLGRSGGLLEDLSTADVSVLTDYRGLEVDAPSTATVVRRVNLGRVTSGTSQVVSQVFVHDCVETPLVAQDLTASWPVSTQVAFGAGHVFVFNQCNQLSLSRLKATSLGHTGVLYGNNQGLFLDNAGGTVDDVDLDIPTSGNPVTNTMGLHVGGPRATFVVSRLTVRSTGGGSLAANGIGVQGVRIDGAVNLGPLSIRQASISIRANESPVGVNVVGGLLGTNMSVTDSVIDVEGQGACNRDVLGVLTTGPVRLERNLITASNGAFVSGVYLSTAAPVVELYGNSVRLGVSNGSSACRSSGSSSIWGAHAVDVSNGATLRAIGNTFDPAGLPGQTGPTVGVGCDGAASLTLGSNIIVGGRGPEARMIGPASQPGFFSCFNASLAPGITNNYFVQTFAGATSPRESLFDGGVLLNGGVGSGNTFGGTSSCFAVPANLPDGGFGFPHFLAPGSACADKGVIGARVDTTLLPLDLFGRPRDGGLGPDIGAVEGP
ncbi:MAG: carboxypeptidase-like regulatory domain-containing protein [Myxococcales bacterium]|nr:carboxypeptidase-like regulatory domain-containing protein [Myxococcales bacterium]